MSTKPVVVIAMSGGVDSSVAAAMLVEQGFSVVGLMLRLWSEHDSGQANRCCTPNSINLARKVASLLSIPFYVLDAQQLFFNAVIKPFITDYTHNLTPNPCIECNRTVRWNFLFNHALLSGADFLTTGHYARISETSDDTFQLLRGIDDQKDQSYVLHVLNQHHLPHTMFPLGNYKKSEVRELAHKYNLPVADRPDSQDLCFVGGNGDYRQFIAHHEPQSINPGNIEDCQGNILGQHQGLAFYTIGQRKGLRLSSAHPLYVIEKDFLHNKLIVGSHDQSVSYGFLAKRVNWISGIPAQSPFNALVKIRYKACDIPCTVDVIDPGTIRVLFGNPVYDVTPGQAAVIYNGEVCLGGGIISNKVE